MGGISPFSMGYDRIWYEKDSNSLLGMAEAQLAFDSEHRLRAENLSWDIDVW